MLGILHFVNSKSEKYGDLLGMAMRQFLAMRYHGDMKRLMSLWATSNSKQISIFNPFRFVRFGNPKGKIWVKKNDFFFMAPSDFSANTHPTWPHMRINRHESNMAASAWPSLVCMDAVHWTGSKKSTVKSCFWSSWGGTECKICFMHQWFILKFSMFF